MKNIYLDNAATTCLSQETKDYIISLLDIYGNPSSLHSEGNSAKSVIEKARNYVANFINADSKNIYFTSGGSASNTLGVRGYLDSHHCVLLYSPILHRSILKCVEKYTQKYAIKVDKYGLLDLDDLENWLKTLQEQAFVVISYADSEIGTIQKTKQIVDLTHKYGGTIFVDCTGSISTIPVNAEILSADMVAFSGHKLGALKGVGVLYKKQKVVLNPLIYGSQENGLIGGTENILGIGSLGFVLSNYDYMKTNSRSRDYIYVYIKRNIPGSYLVGASIESGNRLSHNLYICFKGISGESLMIMLDMNGIQVSTGSACSSGSLATSDTLTAIGMDKNDIHSCIRMSFSGNETKEELDCICSTLKQCVKQLRNFAAI